MTTDAQFFPLSATPFAHRAVCADRARVVTLLTIYLILLVCIPAYRVWSPLGGAGSPANIAAFCLLGWYLILRYLSVPQLARGFRPTSIAAALFACTALMSYLLANLSPLPTLQRNAADRGLISLAGLLGVLLLAADGIASWDGLRILIRRIVASVTGIAAIGIFQFVAGINLAAYVVIPGLITKVQPTDLLVRGGFNRPSATAAHPLELAAVLAAGLPLALHQARFAAAGARARRWSQVGVIAAALPLTLSRSAVLALAAIAITLLPTWSARERRVAYALAASSAGLLWLALPNFVRAFQGLFGTLGSDPSSQSRLSAYSAALPYIESHLWLGIGYNTFLPQTFFFVDNQYLTTLIESGIAGLGTLVGVFGTGWFVARRTRRSLADPCARDLMQSLAASVLTAAISFYTFDALSFSIETGLTFLLLGCIGAASLLAGRQGAALSDG